MQKWFLFFFFFPSLAWIPCLVLCLIATKRRGLLLRKEYQTYNYLNAQKTGVCVRLALPFRRSFQISSSFLSPAQSK